MDEHHQLLKHDPEEYTVYPQRFLVLIVFMIASMLSAVNWITFAPIQARAITYYGLGASWINLLSSIVMILYVPAAVMALTSFRKYGLRRSIVFAGWIDVAAAISRFISVFFVENASFTNHKVVGFIFVFVGHVLIGIGAPFFIIAFVRLASEWFPVSTRDIVVAILSISMALGQGLGSVMPILFVSPNKRDDFGGPGRGFYYLLLTQTVITLLSTLSLVAFFKDRPPTPPSASQHLRLVRERSDDHHENSLKEVWEDTKTAMKNWEFVKLFIGFSIGFGFFSAATTLINQCTAPAGYTTDDAGAFGGLIMGGGLAGAIVFGVLMDVSHAYRKLLVAEYSLVGSMTIVLATQMKPNNLVVLYICFSFWGFFALGIAGIVYEFGAELTFPLADEISTNLLALGGNVYGAILVQIWGGLVPTGADYRYSSVWNQWSWVLVGNIIAMLILCFVKGEFKRLDVEGLPTSAFESPSLPLEKTMRV